METYSQYNGFQDVFALFINQYQPGFVVDIGCRDRVGSNSLLLLKRGWGGVGADINDHSSVWKDYPKFFHQINASIKEDVDRLFANVPSIVDFLSIDVDEASLQCLYNINFDDFKFKCICIEHDFYIHGEKLRSPQRTVLEKNGYKRIIQTAAEDWWIYPKLIDKQVLAVIDTIPEHLELQEAENPIILKWLNID